MKARVVDDLVVNMVDVGEETGELDTMLYKVADTYDDEVKVMTESLTALMEPVIIVFLGFAVGFIVISLFMPLVSHDPRTVVRTEVEKSKSGKVEKSKASMSSP